jgi:hypothetical protein
MTTTTAPAVTGTPQRSAAVGAVTLVAAVAYFVLTGIQIVNPTFDSQLTTAIDYWNDGSFFAGLTLTLVTLVGLRRGLAAPLPAVILGVVGQAMVALGVGIGLATGASPDWAGLVLMPGNLLAWIGLTWLAVWVWRRRALPRWISPLLFLSVPLGVGLAEQGGSIVTAVLWLAVGAQLLRPRV